MGKNFDLIIREVNAISVSEEAPVFKVREEFSNSYNRTHDTTPGYIRQTEVREALGSTVLSLFGGADVSALNDPGVSSLIIVDANPFISKPSITANCAPEEQEGFFHYSLGMFILGYSPYLYATMENYSDYDNPFKLFRYLAYRAEEYLNNPDYRKKLNLPDQDISFEFIKTTSKNAILNTYQVDGIQNRPVVSLDEIGLSTIILLRIRFCLNATIVAIEELNVTEGELFHIEIKRSDGSQASLYYAPCCFGTENKVLPVSLARYIHNHLGGITSVLIRGYPPFFNGKLLGEKESVGSEVREFVRNSLAKSVNELQCIVCTNTGDTIPDFFIHHDEVVSYEPPKNFPNENQEVVFICPGSQLLGTSLESDMHAKKQDEDEKSTLILPWYQHTTGKSEESIHSASTERSDEARQAVSVATLHAL